MKKKMCVILLALAMVLSLGACGAASKGMSYDGASDVPADMNSSGAAAQESEY